MFAKLKRILVGCVLCVASVALMQAAQAKRATIELVRGASITGVLVYEKQELVVMDLGFSVVSVPREDILEIRFEDAEDAGAIQQEGLYHIEKGGYPQPVRDLVDKHGGAVVLVRTPMGLGSGFIIHQDGYVVTNDHVVAGEHEISVTVYEKKEGNLEKSIFDHVRILATSPEQDLALLKIEDEGAPLFKTVPIGDSEQLRQGESVFAVGSPLGLERTVSEGIVSLRNRVIDGRLYIQQTAQISPGNSGGPLFNLKGEVVGVNNMKVVVTGAEGLGFAIPSNVLKVFLRNRDAFAFDPTNPNAGFRYNAPPTAIPDESK